MHIEPAEQELAHACMAQYFYVRDHACASSFGAQFTFVCKSSNRQSHRFQAPTTTAGQCSLTALDYFVTYHFNVSECYVVLLCVAEHCDKQRQLMRSYTPEYPGSPGPPQGSWDFTLHGHHTVQCAHHIKVCTIPLTGPRDDNTNFPDFIKQQCLC